VVPGGVSGQPLIEREHSMMNKETMANLDVANELLKKENVMPKEIIIITQNELSGSVVKESVLTALEADIVKKQVRR